jgi:glutamate-1-semialdehyde aminotransferase
MWNYGYDSYPQAKKTFFAGTYCKHPLALAAARAVLKHLKSHGPSLQQHLNQRTAQFTEALNAYFEEDKLPLQVENFGSVFSLTISEIFALSQNSYWPDIRLILVYYNLIYKGILLRENGGFLSTAHTNEDINFIIQAVQKSIIKFRKEGIF